MSQWSGHKSGFIIISLQPKATHIRKAELFSCHACFGSSFLMSRTDTLLHSRCSFKLSSVVSLFSRPAKMNHFPAVEDEIFEVVDLLHPKILRVSLTAEGADGISDSDRG